MRKIIVAVFVLPFLFGGVPSVHAKDCSQESAFEKAGDWFATLGKDGAEEQQILIKRRAERNLACAKQNLEELSGKSKKSISEALSDIKKKLKL